MLFVLRVGLFLCLLMHKFSDSSLASQEFVQLFKQLKETNPVLDRFDSAAELIDFLHDFKIEHFQENDEVLTALIKEYQSRNNNHLLYNYFFEILSPGLKSVFYRFKKRVVQDVALEDLDLWNQIRLFFLEVLNSYDTRQKPSKVAMTILSRLRSHLSVWHNRLRREQQGVYAYKKEHQDQPYSASMAGHSDIKEELNNLVKREIISQEDLNLILSTRIYGYSLKDISQEKAIAYDVLKKRRQRLEKKILKYLSPKRKF